MQTRPLECSERNHYHLCTSRKHVAIEGSVSPLVEAKGTRRRLPRLISERVAASANRRALVNHIEGIVTQFRGCDPSDGSVSTVMTKISYSYSRKSRDAGKGTT